MFITPLDKNTTVGLYTLADTVAPEPIIKTNIMGDIISDKIAIFLITILKILLKVFLMRVYVNT